ncbi:GSU3473 family protein [Trichloromonas sp.]|uniref:GSU3473 family protein n=1 Tax=Trichloromonas sp. TaxID=3069249 RepID=UPI003D816CA1
MMIPVVTKNGSEQRVFPKVLDEMLGSGQVMFFKRTGGWVVVGRDQTRRKGRTTHEGRERRGQLPEGMLC